VVFWKGKGFTGQSVYAFASWGRTVLVCWGKIKESVARRVSGTVGFGVYGIVQFFQLFNDIIFLMLSYYFLLLPGNSFSLLL
jgi:hypothetical protein